MPSQRVATRGNLVFYCLQPFKPPFTLISHLRHFRTFTLNVHLLSLQTPLPITKNPPNQYQMAHTQVMCSYFNISNLLFRVFTVFFLIILLRIWMAFLCICMFWLWMMMDICYTCIFCACTNHHHHFHGKCYRKFFKNPYPFP